MIERRDFLKGSAAAVSALALGLGVSATAGASRKSAFSGIIYTKNDQGKWNGKAGSHAPEIRVDGSKVTVRTNHPMSAAHFIVRHTLVLENGTVVGAKTFTPTDSPESAYELPAGYQGRIFATSFCNLHDFWLSEAVV